MPKLQPLCSAALIPNVLLRRDEGSGKPCAVDRRIEPHKILAPTLDSNILKRHYSLNGHGMPVEQLNQQAVIYKDLETVKSLYIIQVPASSKRIRIYIVCSIFSWI